MIKRYMSRDERAQFVTFNTLLGFSKENFLPSWKGRQTLLSGEISKIEQAIQLLWDAKESILCRMDGDYRSVLDRDSKSLQIFTMPKDKAEVTLKKYKEADESITIDRTVLDFLAGVSLELCSKCFKSLDEQKWCALRVCYLEVRLEVFNSEAEGCPYKLEDTNVSNEFLRDFVKRLFMEIKSRGGVVAVEDSEDEPSYRGESSLKALEG